MSLKEIIKSIPLDKKEHIVVGVVYSSLIPILSLLFGGVGAIIGFGIGTVLNLYKEVYHDFEQEKGNAELLDFIATQTPIIIVTLTYLIKWNQ